MYEVNISTYVDIDDASFVLSELNKQEKNISVFFNLLSYAVAVKSHKTVKALFYAKKYSDRQLSRLLDLFVRNNMDDYVPLVLSKIKTRDHRVISRIFNDEVTHGNHKNAEKVAGFLMGVTHGNHKNAEKVAGFLMRDGFKSPWKDKIVKTLLIKESKELMGYYLKYGAEVNEQATEVIEKLYNSGRKDSLYVLCRFLIEDERTQIPLALYEPFVCKIYLEYLNLTPLTYIQEMSHKGCERALSLCMRLIAEDNTA